MRLLHSYNIYSLTKLLKPNTRFSYYHSSSVFNSTLKANIEPPQIDNNKSYPKKLVDIVDQIEKLTLLEVADLNSLLQERLNIKPTAVMAPAMVATAPVGLASNQNEEKVPTKSSFSVKLLKFETSQKVALIKEIKSINAEMNLVQAKKFVESAPDFVKRDISKDEADAIKKSLESLGATVEIE